MVLVGIGTKLGNNQLMIVIGLRMVGPGRIGTLHHLDGNIHRDRKTATTDGRNNDDPHMEVIRPTAHGIRIVTMFLRPSIYDPWNQNDV